jgi:hypothetical protein
MHAKLFVELGVEVGSRLVDSAASRQCGIVVHRVKLANRWPAAVFNAHAQLSYGLFLSLMAHLD